MCIAILNKKGLIDKETLRECWVNNPDGAGFGWVDSKGLQTMKFGDKTSFDDIYDEYEKIRQNTEYPIMLHFRIATHGGINIQSTHPFNINEDVIVCHNGIIPNFGTKSLVDTQDFIDRVLKFFPPNFYLNDVKIETIEMLIGNSKLIFLDSQGSYSIINSQKGEWDADKNNWYSNSSYKKAKPVVYHSKSYRGWPSEDKKDYILSDIDWYRKYCPEYFEENESLLYDSGKLLAEDAEVLAEDKKMIENFKKTDAFAKLIEAGYSEEELIDFKLNLGMTDEEVKNLF